MLAFLIAAALAGGSCANPTIVSARVQSVTTNGALKHYALAVTVRNRGTLRQPSNLLQSIDVYQDGEHVNRIGLQPLRPGQSQTVTHSFIRSDDAADGSTVFTFTLNLNGRSGANVDCRAGRESVDISV